MRGEGRAAIAHVSMHRRAHGHDRGVRKTGLIADTMFCADEVRTVEEFRSDIGLVSTKEVELGVGSSSDQVEPDEFKDQFRERLNELISARTDKGSDYLGSSAKVRQGDRHHGYAVAAFSTLAGTATDLL